MKKDLLGQLFESEAKVRLLRLFLASPYNLFSLRELGQKTKTNTRSIAKELRTLRRVNFVRGKVIREAGKKKKKRVFFANPSFSVFSELQQLFARTSPDIHEDLRRRIRRLGRIQLAVAGGIFTGNEDAKADLLLVGPAINKRKVGSFIGDLEAELGRGINCVMLDLKEFQYRYNLYDRFLRDMLHPGNIRLIDRIKL